jgi:hypothetical protein
MNPASIRHHVDDKDASWENVQPHIGESYEELIR